MTIELHGGQVAKIDKADHAALSTYRWYICNGYAASRAGGKTVYMHRLVARPEPGQVIDHINHDKLDNRRRNLRSCTQSQNMRNMSKLRTNTSGFIGVRLFRNRWKAEVSVDNKNRHIGMYDTPEEAARARDDYIRGLGERIFVPSSQRP